MQEVNKTQHIHPISHKLGSAALQEEERPSCFSHSFVISNECDMYRNLGRETHGNKLIFTDAQKPNIHSLITEIFKQQKDISIIGESKVSL